MNTARKRIKKIFFYTTITVGMTLMFFSLYFGYKSLSGMALNNQMISKSATVFSKSLEFALKNKEVQSYTRELLLGVDVPHRGLDSERQLIDGILDTLSILVEEDAEQTQLVKEMGALSVELMDLQELAVRIQQTEGQEAATKFIQSGRGAQIYQSIKDKAEQVHEIERHRLDYFETDTGYVSKATLYYIIGMSVTGISGFCITIIWLFYLFKNRNKDRFLRKELHRREQILKQYLEAIPDGIIVISTNEEVKIINRSGRELIRLGDANPANLEELIRGIPLENKEHYMEIYRQGNLPLKKGLSGERSIGNRFDIIIDGKIRNMETNVQPIYNLDETLIGAVCVIRDITEKENYAANLKAERDLVEKSMRARNIFLSSVSHEIRTPLNTIIGFTDLLKLEVNDRKAQEYAKYIEIASKNLLRLMNDILDLSKMEFGQLVLDLEPTAVAELVESVSVLIGKRARDKGINYRYELSEYLPKTIKTDKIRLTQILLNLCQNAIKFTEKGEVLLNVEPAGVKKDGRQMIRFVVKDTGIGIPEERQKKVFETFVQADEKISSQYGGTGLGLAIVKYLVGYFDGTIKLESKEKVGTTFTLEFPFEVIESFDGESSPNTTEEEIIPAGLNGLKILAAEDNVLNQKLLRAVFDRTGIVLEIVNNGKEVLEKLNKYAYDLIIMDVQMPEMDGYTAIKEIRKKLKLETPIIMMTAHTMAGEREEGLRIGANSYLSKPFQRLELFSTIINLTHKAGVQTEIINTAIENNSAIESQRVDLGYLHEITGGSESLKQELVQLFENDGIVQLEIIREKLANQDYDGLKHAIHKFRSSLYSVGMLPLARRLKEIESALGKQIIPENLTSEIEEVVSEVQAGLSELKSI